MNHGSQGLVHAGQHDYEEPAMGDSHLYSVSVSAAVRDEAGQFLAIRRRDNGHWEPPGGIVEPGERLEDALVREVVEETGYVVRPIALSGVYQNVRLNVVSLVFSCVVEGGEPATGLKTKAVDDCNMGGNLIDTRDHRGRWNTRALRDG
jgi:8-oxo-dGTP pyrophosphatase MutT (NUDIX family)